MDYREFFRQERFNYEAFYKNHLEAWDDMVGRNGPEVVGICPFHDDTQQSFNANNQTGLWYCHGCGRSGWVGTFLQLFEGLSRHKDAILLLQKHKDYKEYWGSGAEIKESYAELEARQIEIPPPIDVEIIQIYLKALTPEKIDWLINKRGLSKSIISRAMIGFDNSSGRYALPIRNKTGNEFIDVRFYHPDPPPTGKVNKKGEPIMEPKMKSFDRGYGYKKWYSEALLQHIVSKKGARYLICEGEFDQLCAMSHGIMEIATWINGAQAIPPSFHEYARDAAITTVFDNDQAGITMSRETARQALIAGAHSVDSIMWPEGYKTKGDITDWFVEFGHTVKELFALRRKIWTREDFEPDELKGTKQTKPMHTGAAAPDTPPEEDRDKGLVASPTGPQQDGSFIFPSGNVAKPWNYWKKRMNKEHSLIAYEGKVFIMRKSQVFNKEKLTYFQTKAFKELYNDKLVIVGTDETGEIKTKKVGDWWLENQLDKTTYDGITFAPGAHAKNVPKTYFNLFRGFDVNPKQGNWFKLKDHLFEVICSGNPEHMEYLINWMAWIVQRPHEPTRVSLVLQGGKGVGKGAFVNAFGKIFGNHFKAIADQTQLKSSFTDYVEACLVLFFDEGFFAGDKSTDGKVKAFITEETLNINRKFKDTVKINNYLNLIFASNEDRPVNATIGERRYFSLKVSDKRKGDYSYFDELFEEIDNGGVAAMLYDLLNIPLTGFRPNRVPKTEALKDQVSYNLPTHLLWIADVLADGYIELENRTATFPDKIIVAELYQHYLEYVRGLNERRPLAKNILTKKMTEIFGQSFSSKQKIKMVVKRVWDFRDPEKMKQQFDDYCGFSFLGEQNNFRDVEQTLFSNDDDD